MNIVQSNLKEEDNNLPPYRGKLAYFEHASIHYGGFNQSVGEKEVMNNNNNSRNMNQYIPTVTPITVPHPSTLAPPMPMNIPMVPPINPINNWQANRDNNQNPTPNFAGQKRATPTQNGGPQNKLASLCSSKEIAFDMGMSLDVYNRLKEAFYAEFQREKFFSNN